jgi:hypothetical protein
MVRVVHASEGEICPVVRYPHNLHRVEGRFALRGGRIVEQAEDVIGPWRVTEN